MADLSEVRVAVVATDGVEEAEITEPIRALRDAGARVDVVAPHPGRIQAMRHDDKGIDVDVDRTLDDAQPGDYDALVLPGGALNADKLRVDPQAQSFARGMQTAGKPIAVICHAPWLLVSSGLVPGRTLTSYYTLQDDIRNAGGFWVDQEVVEDSNWVSSRGPQDLSAFVDATIHLFAGLGTLREPALVMS